jgi:hypothetical protein
MRCWRVYSEVEDVQVGAIQKARGEAAGHLYLLGYANHHFARTWVTLVRIMCLDHALGMHRRDGARDQDKADNSPCDQPVHEHR